MIAVVYPLRRTLGKARHRAGPSLPEGKTRDRKCTPNPTPATLLGSFFVLGPMAAASHQGVSFGDAPLDPGAC